MNVQEDLLGYFGVPFGTGPSKVVEANIEPFVHFGVYLIVKITHLFGSLLLFDCFNFSGCTVFVSSANIEHIGSL